MNNSIILNHGNKKVIVQVEVRPNRKHLSIAVHPNLRVVAKVPEKYDPQMLHQKLQKRLAWITKQLNYFDQFQPLPSERLFVPGETHLYLGRQYRLKFSTSIRSRVRLIGRYFHVEMSDPTNREKAKRLMMKWYAIHAKNLLSKRLDRYLPTFLKLGATLQNVRFRRMKRRWGSCTGKGTITLNTELVKAPIHCIDYVIVHELCHLLYPRHDRNFYRLLSRVMPDWERRKQRLEQTFI